MLLSYKSSGYDWQKELGTICVKAVWLRKKIRDVLIGPSKCYPIRQAYEKEHIPGAVHFSLDAAHYPSQYIRFDLYSPEEFEKFVRLLGINAGDHIVVYARGLYAGMLWASRVWWLFKLYGHDKVSVLDGGLDAWKKAGKSVSGDVTSVKVCTAFQSFVCRKK
ncbi:unnamed protein product [Strongylus vulgaris]|uniref:Rhodanese domain-containing protein n=1 Tax=Strongylus vulgaris TaxID=40348 RepID=A0A3P7KWG1_STRVU|nr:unnamed protein product [Strongylus vulgaris]